MTWVLYNDEEIILETNDSLVQGWLQIGYALHGQSDDDEKISAYVDEINSQ